jgi:hypothetical protein
VSEFTPAQLIELEGLIAERATAQVIAFLTQRMVTPHDAEAGPFAFDSATPNIDQTRKASIDSTRLNLNDLNTRVTTINGAYLPTAGGSMTGDLNVGGAVDTFPKLKINPPTGDFNAELSFIKGTSYRWSWLLTSEPEAGANAGSNFQLWRYADGGAASIFEVQNRATGSRTMYSQLFIVDPTTQASGVFNLGNQTLGGRGLQFNSAIAPAGVYNFSGAVPIRAACYQLVAEPAVAVGGNVTVDFSTSSAFVLTVTAAAAISFSNTTFGHVQLRMIMSTTAQPTFPQVTAWLGDAAQPTFANGSTYFINLFVCAAGVFAQSAKVGA